MAPVVEAVRTAAAIAIDGKLTEAAWASATAATDFTQMDPTEGEPASEETRVRILYDERYIYVGARLSDKGVINARLGRRDSDLPDSDWFAISLDAYHDHQTSARFAVNPAGVVGDRIVVGSLGFGGDASWDPVWEVETVVDSGGWTVEMRIPLSQLRFGRDDVQTWGIQIDRRIGRKNEFVVLAYTPRNERPGVARYAHLEGISGVRPPRQQIEFLPYGLGKADYTAARQNASAGFANPYRDGSLNTGGVGMDIKYRPTSNVTIDAAVNPDFGQVEVDPAVINLSAFETRFQEKRPFFVEGSELFRFGGGGGGRRWRRWRWWRRWRRWPRWRPDVHTVFTTRGSQPAGLGARRRRLFRRADRSDDSRRRQTHHAHGKRLVGGHDRGRDTARVRDGDGHRAHGAPRGS